VINAILSSHNVETISMGDNYITLQFHDEVDISNMVKFRFPKLKYGSSSHPLRAAVQKHPFLLFGLPFIAMVAGASFLVTPMTATRYDHYDKKFRRSDRQKAIDDTGVKRRKFDAREEYYVRNPLISCTYSNKRNRD
jgi:hypothetical protein